MTRKVKVFVYGTLMSGFGNNRVLGKDAALIGRGYIRGYSMLDLGAYPGIRIAGNCPRGKGIVHGELWEISEGALIQVDALEGAPTLYERRSCWVSFGNPETENELFYSDRQRWFTDCSQEALTYLYLGAGFSLSHRSRVSPTDSGRVPCGDWRKHTAALSEIKEALKKARAG